MPRLILALSGVGLLLAACAGGSRPHLDAHGIALAGEVGTDGQNGRIPRVVDASAVLARNAMAGDAQALEQRLRREVDRLAAGGSAALEMIEPGTSVESRLRFALSRQELGRDAEATKALVALTGEVPGCALAWLLLGEVRAESGDAKAAVACLRQARQVEREQGAKPHPNLNYELGRALLQTEEDEEGIRLLREELAAGSNRVAAAELLAGVFGEVGDFEQALACLDAVLDDVPDSPPLLIAKADLLADMLRFAEARALLEKAKPQLTPATWLFRRAVFLQKQGDQRAALASLDVLQQQHGGEPQVQAAMDNVHSLRTEVQADVTAGARTRRSERELLGILRFAEQPMERVDAAALLCAKARAAVVPAAMRWALRDRHEAVRIAAIQNGIARCENPVALVETGLEDGAASVRAATAVVAARLPARSVFGVLVGAVERETDPDAFRTLHRALGLVSGRDVDMPFGGERDGETRRKVAGEWRSTLAQVEKDAARDTRRERGGS